MIGNSTTQIKRQRFSYEKSMVQINSKELSTVICKCGVCKKIAGAGVYIGSVGWWRSRERENHRKKEVGITCVEQEFLFVPLQIGIYMLALKCGTKGWYVDVKINYFWSEGVAINNSSAWLVCMVWAPVTPLLPNFVPGVKVCGFNLTVQKYVQNLVIYNSLHTTTSLLSYLYW